MTQVPEQVIDMTDLIAEHTDWMRYNEYGERSIADRIKVLAHANRHLPYGLEDVATDEIAAYLANPAWSRWTAHTYYSHLAGFYRWAASYPINDPWMSCDPTAGMRPPPCGKCRPKPVSPEELRTALERSSDPWLTAIVLAVGAGLRASEIATILREDVTEGYVHVRHGKGGKERYVDCCATVWAHVKDRPPGPLVRHRYGRPVTTAYLSSCQQRHWRSIGLPRLHLHRLRHTFATAIEAAGHDLLVIRDLMGHASVATTQMYVAVSGIQRRLAVTALDALFSSR